MEFELNPQSDLPQSSSFDEKSKNAEDSESDIEILEEVPFTPPLKTTLPTLDLNNFSPIQQPKILRKRDNSNNSETKSNDSGFGDLNLKHDASRSRFVEFRCNSF